MAPKGSSKGKGKVSAKMPTSVMTPHLSLNWDLIKAFISERSCALTQIYNFCSIKDERWWDLLYDIIFLDPVMTRHFSQCQLMWPHHRSRSSPFREWWAAFRSFMGQLFVKTCNKMNNWWWDNPRAFGDQVDRSNSQRTSSGKVKCTGEHFSWYCSDDCRAKIELASCRLLWGFLIPIINTTFIELSTTTYLMISLSPCIILRLNLLHHHTRACQIEPPLQSFSFV